MQPKQPELPKLPRGVLNASVFACAATLAAGAYATLNHPLSNWRSQSSQKAEQVRLKLAEEPQLKRTHAEQEKRLERLLAYVDDVNRRIPDKPQENEFLADITRLAGECGLVIEDFRRGKTIETPTHSAVSVEITTHGDHTGICKLINSVAELPRLVELTDLAIENDGADGHYPVNMAYLLYYGMVTTTSEPQVASE